MIGVLRNLARRREALVALSDAQRALLTLELHDLRRAGWSRLVGRRFAPRLSAALTVAAVAAGALIVARPRRALKLASAALAVYPFIRRLIAVIPAR